MLSDDRLRIVSVTAQRLLTPEKAFRPFRLFFFLLLVTTYGVFPQEHSACERLRHKHTARIEAWSVYARVTDRAGRDRYCALFFLSGKMLVLSGNYVHYSMLALPERSYTHENYTAIPPFTKVRHDFSSLDERIGSQSLRGTPASKAVTVTTNFSGLRARISVVPRKPCVTFRDIIGGRYDKRKFDWYMQPRCEMTIRMEGDTADTLFGEGHFQQFWGETAETDCNWMVLHLQSGYDMIVARFPERKLTREWLPGNYIFLSRPDGSVRKITDFTLNITGWWKSPATKKKYPLASTVTAPHQGIALSIRALIPDQAKNIARKEFWFGFGSVNGTVNGEEQQGWAYLAPPGTSP